MEKEDKFHEELKNSFVLRPAVPHLDDTAPASETGAAAQMKELQAALGSNSHQKTYIYCMIERNLSMLQSAGRAKNLWSLFSSTACKSLQQEPDLLFN